MIEQLLFFNNTEPNSVIIYVCVCVCVYMNALTYKIIYNFQSFRKSRELAVMKKINWLNFLLLSHNDHNLNAKLKNLEK